ncbi:ATP-binding protein [Flavobacterium sp. DG1-102-2]|uniref:ATP-binding protein n=1 Tax=Flavobacterium sp. DG1-102-2 TaxID=3081663 RepID=UPI00294A7C57|nr:ATP-binding protein [Flavobacterium sp. DG1-102-2]MDV6170201.1 ATP-binding protein [Flavobacterium sp. DG1-102-2]
MTNLEKDQIVSSLKTYISRYESQNKAANSLKSVSAATISQMVNGKWELIKDEMWRNVAAQIGEGDTDAWKIVETSAFKVLNSLLTDAQLYSNVFGVIGKAGSSKTTAMKAFENNPDAFRLQCAEYWNRKYFLSELLSKMGKDSSGLTVAEMMRKAVETLKKKDRPVIILDEADKLSDQVLYFFITLYNELENHCGIVMCATNFLEKRIKKGLQLNKKGYNEIYSRLGRNFIELPDVSFSDVMQVCVANGVSTDLTIMADDGKGGKVKKNAIEVIFRDSDGDLRRVERKVHAIKKGLNNAS